MFPGLVTCFGLYLGIKKKFLCSDEEWQLKKSHWPLFKTSKQNNILKKSDTHNVNNQVTSCCSGRVKILCLPFWVSFQFHVNKNMINFSSPATTFSSFPQSSQAQCGVAVSREHAGTAGESHHHMYKAANVRRQVTEDSTFQQCFPADHSASLGHGLMVPEVFEVAERSVNDRVPTLNTCRRCYSKVHTSRLWMLKSCCVERGWLLKVAHLEEAPRYNSASSHRPSWPLGTDITVEVLSDIALQQDDQRFNPCCSFYTDIESSPFHKVLVQLTLLRPSAENLCCLSQSKNSPPSTCKPGNDPKITHRVKLLSRNKVPNLKLVSFTPWLRDRSSRGRSLLCRSGVRSFWRDEWRSLQISVTTGRINTEHNFPMTWKSPRLQ